MISDEECYIDQHRDLNVKFSSSDGHKRCNKHSHEEVVAADENNIQESLFRAKCFLIDNVKGLTEFLDGDYAALKKILLKDYKSTDTSQQMPTLSFLSSLKDKVLFTDADVTSSCRRYASISATLVKDGKLDSHTQMSWFLRGLPTDMETELFYRYNLDPDGDEKPEFFRALTESSG